MPSFTSRSGCFQARSLARLVLFDFMSSPLQRHGLLDELLLPHGGAFCLLCNINIPLVVSLRLMAQMMATAIVRGEDLSARAVACESEADESEAHKGISHPWRPMRVCADVCHSRHGALIQFIGTD